MTVLDSFYILFKSNADEAVAATKKVESATNAVTVASDQLLKAQEDAGKKVGKNLSEQERLIVVLQQKKKAATQEQRAAEKEQDRIDKERLSTGNEFVKILEKTTAAAAAYFSVSAVAGGIFNAAKNNSDLKVQSDLLGQSIDKVKALDAAGRAAGGQGGGILAQYSAVFHDLSSKGLKAPDIETLNRFYHEQLKLPQFQGKEGAARFFQSVPNAPITDRGQQDFLLKKDADFEKELTANRELIGSQDKAAEKAREFNKAMAEMSTLFDSIFTQIGYKFLPILTWINKELVGINGAVTDSEEYRNKTDKTWAGKHNGQSSPSLPLPPGVVAEVNASTPSLASSSRGAKDSMAFWMSEGYTREQAAGIAANEMRESGFNPRARGDGGRAAGLYQWHPDRVENIKRGIGIDVTTASADDQRRAAAWEINQMGLGGRLRASAGGDETASVFSRGFERPANGALEAMVRGQMALRLASDSSFGMGAGNTSNSKSINVKIGDINVNAAGGNSAEIAKNTASELTRQLRDAIANTDDGVAM